MRAYLLLEVFVLGGVGVELYLNFCLVSSHQLLLESVVGHRLHTYKTRRAGVLVAVFELLFQVARELQVVLEGAKDSVSVDFVDIYGAL